MKNRTVCFFNSNLTWGGGEKWHYDISTRLCKRGFNPIVMANPKGALASRLRKTSIPVFNISISNLSFLNIHKIYKIYKMLKMNRIDIIMMNVSEDVKAAGIAAKLAGVKKIIYRRGSAIPIADALLNRLIFKYIITRVIANSEQTRKTVLQNNQNLFPFDKISIIYNGIDLREYDALSAEPVFKRENDTIIMGNAGRFVEQKGQKQLIEIARKLKSKSIKFKLLIAGDGKLKEELIGYSKDCDVDKEVVFIGFVENIKSFMETIDIFLLPSLYEGFGYVIVEAMASGKPVIAFNTSSNPEIILNGQTGFLVEKNDIEAFQEKIIHLIKNKPLRHKMGFIGRKRIETSFSIGTAVEAVISVLNE